MITLLVSALLQTPAAAAADRALTWTECPRAEVPVRCGTLRVPEDHDRATGRQIRLAVFVLPARRQPAAADPILLLFGGPGDAGSNRLGALSRAYSGFNATRDILVIDQRGTGASASVACHFGDPGNLQSYVSAFFPLAELAACRKRLQPNADLARYRTIDFVRDLEVLRRELGVARFNLFGDSYGSRVALEYMARLPDRVRSATLVGVSPPHQAAPEHYAEDAQRAVNKVIGECMTDSRCRTAFPALASELGTVLQQLERGPVEAMATDSATMRTQRVTLSRAGFGEAARAMLYSPRGASQLPLAVHEAFGGNFSAFATVVATRHADIARRGSLGLYLAVTCTEDIPRIDTAVAQSRARGTVFGEGRLLGHLAACDGWPRRGTVELPELSHVTAPILMMVGDHDPVTPPRWAQMVARAVPKSRLLIVPRGGHGFGGMEGVGCLTAIRAAFVERPDPAALDVSCVNSIRAPAFLLRR